MGDRMNKPENAGASETGMYEKIGKYTVVEPLGEGGMAEVFKVHDPELDCDLALKILKKEFCGNVQYEKRFLHDARALSAIQHQGIATVHNVGKVDERPYMVMELLKASPLEATIESGRALPVKQVLQYGIQLADAIACAHKKGIYHRDIKPENILMGHESGLIKLTDFGIASMNNKNPKQTRLTLHGMVVGTPGYMSPEQWMGKRVDGRSDLFSLGVVLYALCSGARPFDGDTVETLESQTRDDAHPSIRKRVPDLPVGVARIIDKLLQKEPDKRFQSAAELSEALRRELAKLEEQEAGKKRPVSARVWIAAAAGVLLVIAAGIFFYPSGPGTTPHNIVIDSGVASAKVLAHSVTINLALNEWQGIKTVLDRFKQGRSFGALQGQALGYLYVLDKHGVVRGAGDPSGLGKLFTPPGSPEQEFEAKGVRVSTLKAEDGSEFLDFNAPILFGKKNREIGRVHLGYVQSR